jgi:hypothetical protein
MRPWSPSTVARGAAGDGGGRVGEEEADVLVHLRPVALERQAVLGPGGGQRRGGLALAVQGVEGDGAAAQVEPVEQPGQGRDLAGVAAGEGHLGEDQAGLGGEGAERGQGRAAAGRVGAAARGLAVDGDVPAGGDQAGGLGEQALEGLGPDQTEDAAEGGVGRGAAGAGGVAAQEVEAQLGELGDVVEVAAAAQGGAKRGEQHLGHGMFEWPARQAAAGRTARVLDVREELFHAAHLRRCASAAPPGAGKTTPPPRPGTASPQPGKPPRRRPIFMKSPCIEIAGA